MLLARDDRELDRARRLLDEEHRADVLAIRCDIRRRSDVRAAAIQILEQCGVVDVLINNAGVIQVGPLEHMQHEDFENAMATHFWGPLNLMLELIPSMRRRGFGRIVNIARSADASPCRTWRPTRPASSRSPASPTPCAPSSRPTGSA